MAVDRKVWREKFSDWFRDVIDKAGILDYRYPVKGCGVWLSYGFKLRNNVMNVVRRLLDETGHEEMLFPLLIPEDFLAKESAHIRSFEEESYWVTRGGSTPLEVKLALRPTSETVITPMVKLWVRSHADLPKKLYQIASIFRYETKATRPMIRVREVTTFKEAHTFHASHEEAVQQVWKAIEIYKKFYDEIGVPYVLSQRPEWDKFAGAVTSYAFDTVFPDGRSLQIGTSHDLGQNFGRAFDFTFETSDGGQEYVWQTSYGISERIIAAVIAMHGDDHGLVLPPRVAPVHVVIVPIPYKGVEEEVNKVSKGVAETLKKAGIRVELDDRPKVTPGSKFYEWELRGVPVRVEVGPRDVKTGEVTLVRRDTLKRASCREDKVVEEVEDLLAKIQGDLKKRAWKWLRNHINGVEDLKEARRLIDEGSGIVETPWCGDEKCGVRIEKKVDARVLGVPSEIGGKAKGRCLICGRPARFTVRLAKAY